MAAVEILRAAFGRFIGLVSTIQGFTLFAATSVRSSLTPPYYRHEAIHQLHFVTIGSLLIVAFSTLIAGQALALQLARELANTGAKSQLGHFMSISVVRALGPIMVGMVVASRMAAGITAELGAMRATDQIDALVAFGTDPIKRLVAPRVLALLLGLPALTVVGDLLAIIGGSFVGLQYHLPLESYYNGVIRYLTPKNLLVGMIKPFIFAVLIAVVACWKGFVSAGGAKGVGLATTQSVVISIVGILVTDGICTRLVFKMLGW